MARPTRSRARPNYREDPEEQLPEERESTGSSFQQSSGQNTLSSFEKHSPETSNAQKQRNGFSGQNPSNRARGGQAQSSQTAEPSFVRVNAHSVHRVSEPFIGHFLSNINQSARASGNRSHAGRNHDAREEPTGARSISTASPQPAPTHETHSNNALGATYDSNSRQSAAYRWVGSYGAAERFMTRVRRGPMRDPQQDPTIQQVGSNSPFWTRLMFAAFIDMHDVADDPDSLECKIFQFPVYEQDEIEAVSLQIFDALMFLCTAGYQGDPTQDWGRYPMPGDELDRTGSCLDRVKAIVVILSRHKWVCWDMMRIGKSAMIQLVNSPCHYLRTHLDGVPRMTKLPQRPPDFATSTPTTARLLRPGSRAPSVEDALQAGNIPRPMAPTTSMHHSGSAKPRTASGASNILPPLHRRSLNDGVQNSTPGRYGVVQQPPLMHDPSSNSTTWNVSSSHGSVPTPPDENHSAGYVANEDNTRYNNNASYSPHGYNPDTNGFTANTMLPPPAYYSSSPEDFRPSADISGNMAPIALNDTPSFPNNFTSLYDYNVAGTGYPVGSNPSPAPIEQINLISSPYLTREPTTMFQPPLYGQQNSSFTENLADVSRNLHTHVPQIPAVPSTHTPVPQTTPNIEEGVQHTVKHAFGGKYGQAGLDLAIDPFLGFQDSDFHFEEMFQFEEETEGAPGLAQAADSMAVPTSQGHHQPAAAVETSAPRAEEGSAKKRKHQHDDDDVEKDATPSKRVKSTMPVVRNDSIQVQ